MSIYEEFAKTASNAGLEWIVLHGVEGYPDSIGRDLDAYCQEKKDILPSSMMFEKIALENPDTRWVVFPHPIWGKRILAISKNYDVAELHILYKINSGVICFEPSFDNKAYIGDFPYEESAMEFKAIVMSLLGNNKKVLQRMETTGIATYSKALQQAYIELRDKGKISLLAKMRIYLKYASSMPQIIKSLQYSISVKKASSSASTTRVIKFSNYSEEKYSLLRGYLCEVFTDFKCADQMSIDKIIRYTSRQQFVYFTKDREDFQEKVAVIDLSNVENAAEEILDDFNAYNVENRLAMFSYR